MNNSRVRSVWLVLSLVFLVFAAYGSLVGSGFQETDFQEAAQRFRLGLKNWSFGGSSVDWGVNVLLFVPISFCLLSAVSPPRSLPLPRFLAVMAVTASCGVATLAIEFAQNWFPSRVSSASDVVAQFIGVLVQRELEF